jgi:uncharacterized lipoprotein YddW (UPF0748 family)
MKYKRDKFIKISFLIYFISTTACPLFAQTNYNNEMRGVWMATTKNIDWPSNKYLSPEKQRTEFRQLLNLFQSIGLNAVFVQIRPAADAFFPSPYEPWSEWLCGKQGKAPEPFYDPLEFMILETHKRGMEFHAWINPFRAVANIETADIAANHITRRKPEWFFTYGINTYFNPGIPEVREYVIKIIDDIVTRYDVDGIHFDDYFYPYPEKDENKNIKPIPDSQTFKEYGHGMKLEDWRRENMNVFIRDVNFSIKKIKPYVKFGIGPSGVWRNKGHDQKGSDSRGFEHYDYLYADVLKWLREGWIDYVAPQLYWNIGNKYADYATMVEWWSKNVYGRHLYIGQGVYMAAADAPEKAWQNPRELPNQLRINRENPVVLGSIFYKTSSVKKNPLGFDDSLRISFYKKHVKTPKMSWLPERPAPDTTKIIDTFVLVVDRTPPSAPTEFSVKKVGKYYLLTWEKPKMSGIAPNDTAAYYAVYKFSGSEAGDTFAENIYEITLKNYILIPRNRFAFFRRKFTFVVTAFDKAKNESRMSRAITLKMKK